MRIVSCGNTTQASSVLLGQAAAAEDLETDHMTVCCSRHIVPECYDGLR